MAPARRTPPPRTAALAPAARPRAAATVRRVERASGGLATAALAAMDERLRWFRDLPAEQRSWVGLVAQTGVAAFLDWLRHPDREGVTGEVFRAAPRELTRVITLAQTVELVRVTVEVVESQVDSLAAPGEEALLREAVLRFSRDIAFAAAGVYAQAAEARGAWDARLEALVVDALLRGETGDALHSRMSALGWDAVRVVSVLVGSRPDGDAETVLAALHDAARGHRLELLAAVQGERLVVVLGPAADPLAAARWLLPQFGAGPVVLGPAVPDLTGAAHSAAVALAALRAAPAWPDAPRPVPAEDLLPERALAGEPQARAELVAAVYAPLVDAGGAVLETMSAYVESAGTVEGTARALFVHPNTVRYRLRRVTEITGCIPGTPRGAFTLRVALAVGRLGQ